MLAKSFLAVVGLIYLALAAWCTIAPARTSQTVGFELKGGSGRSEFLVIYGGLELALALMFLGPLLKPEYLRPALVACVLIHACLVFFRTISFGLYEGISSTTYRLAVGEWIVLLAALMVWWKSVDSGPANP